MTRTYPDGFDADDQAFVDALTPDDVFISELIAAVAWMDAEGTYHWRCYFAGDERVVPSLGLLELAKLDLIARSDTGLPIAYPDDEESSDDPT